MTFEVKRKLNVAFDLHGVADTIPEIVKPLMKTFRASGHKVFICSGPTIEHIRNELEKKGYVQNHHYDEIVSVVDFLENEGIPFDYDEKGRPWTTDEIWWSSKGKIAKKYKIDLVIDNTEKYGPYMPKDVFFLLMK